ncbi:MBL fold metallo-hydrolase [Schaalia sp. 19OD2882]|uniref:MBL fold metallo-hydrolase RNA specificity domain-containing protein n=1 Tax=Schaalia sp. 19OD2882 TaxID=2794089 RepID=UPI001C1EA137|nr:MBL fold metallo-hydrolase [Schaalia sp. 19OD2882]QWW19072.1 MBL fold metallo-hydrolase [Schaalia sp. 19OD2882]
MGTTTLSFLGAAGTVTGSKHLLTLDAHTATPRHILVDCGMYQGEKHLRRLNWADFPIPPSSISDVLLTHAHMDHSGMLPRLVKQGFHGRIWCTRATADLTEIILRDSAFLQERDAEYARERGYSKHRSPEPLYRIGDVENTLPLFRTVDFDTELDLGDAVVATWVRSGHILGSASIHVRTDEGSVLFSGDIGRHTHPVLRPREIPPGADVVLVESTYGDREHFEPQEPPHEVFADAIRRTIERGGSVLVPAFAVDRTEVVLHTLARMQAEGRIPRVPVFMDSPMALASLRIYQAPRNAEELTPEVQGLALSELDLREVRDPRQSQRLNHPEQPCIIISASGMATGGRVLHHLETMLPDPRHTVVLTGYQAVGTRGRALVEGARHLKMYGAYVAVRAQIVRDEEFSVHADGSELVDWIAALDPPPSHVFCVHGEPESAQALSERLGDEVGVVAVVPTRGEHIRVRSGRIRQVNATLNP